MNDEQLSSNEYQPAMNLQPFLELRRYLQIVHHVPGRIRLRIKLALVKELKRVNTGVLDDVMQAIDGISDVRVNAAAGSVVVNYRAKSIAPDWWTTLIEGDENQALSLLQRLIAANPAAVSAAQQT